MSRKAILVLTCGAAVMFLTMGVRQSFGLYLGPISTDLGLPTQVFALSLAVQNLLLGVLQPFSSALADKFGTARMVAVGGVMHVVGVLIMANANSAWDLHTGAGLLVGLASTATTFSLILGAVGRAVSPEKRSLALGIAAACASLGQLIGAPLNQELIGSLGWSPTLIFMAMALGLIVPLSMALRGKASETHEPHTEGQTLTQALFEAGRHPSYILLTTGFFVCGFQVIFVAVHFPNFLAIHGKPELAGTAMGLIGFTNFIGTLAFGALGARYSKKCLLSGLYFLRSVAFAVFIAMPLSDFSILFFASFIGFLWLGTVPLTSGLVAQMFGVRYMATLGGIVFMSHQFGSFLGSFMGGVLFDATGSYDIMWYAAIALGIAAAIIHLPIREHSVRAIES